MKLFFKNVTFRKIKWIENCCETFAFKYISGDKKTVLNFRQVKSRDTSHMGLRVSRKNGRGIFSW